MAADKERRLALLKAEASLIVPGEVGMVAHALVLPTDDPEERKRYDADVEAIAVRLARVHEEAAGATVHDVSRPELARLAGLNDWPGFDLHSLRPASIRGPAEKRAIEVKGCARSGGVEVSENEWAKACNGQLRLGMGVASTNLFGHALSLGDQLGCLVVVASCQPIEAFGQAEFDLCLVFSDNSAQSLLVEPVASGFR